MLLANGDDNRDTPLHFTPETEPVAEWFRSALLAQLPTLRLRAGRLEPTAGEADDLVQDTIERSLRSWRLFRPGPESNLRAWLLTIMQNVFFDRCRTRSRVAFLHQSCARNGACGEPPDALEPWQLATLADVRELASEMPRTLSEALDLVFFQGKSYAQAAGQLGIRVPTVGTRLLRARAYLRTTLQKRLALGSRMSNYVS